jgi:release factor glutamine methyltransferase
MTSVAEIIAAAAERLRDAGVPEAQREAVSLVDLTLQRGRAFLTAHPEYELSADEKDRFEEYLARRERREPLQYIRGTQEFYGLEFEVTPDVLIPRPETELLVEMAVEYAREMDAPRILDIGVGSGCIIVSLLRMLPQASGVGADRSEAAIAIAGRNAEKHGVAERLELMSSDVFDGIPSRRFDLIVSNPPYVPAAELESLQKELDFEPRNALTDGNDGLDIIRRIVAGAPDRLVSKGTLFIEIGLGQDTEVSKMLRSDVWGAVEVLPDLRGIPRVVRAMLKTLGGTP